MVTKNKGQSAHHFPVFFWGLSESSFDFDQSAVPQGGNSLHFAPTPKID